MRLLLFLVSLLVPRSEREQWREEWRAELRHGGWRMITGALPDVMALRALGRTGTFHALDQDVRYAFRTLATGKSFTLAVVGSLAVGIGATVAAFSMVNATLLRPSPEIRAQEELAWITLGWRPGSTGGRAWIHTAWQDYEVLRDGIPALENLSIAHDTALAVAPGGGQEPRSVDGVIVSGNYFDVFGVTPAVGRFFVPDEDGVPWARPALVVSHQYWQRCLSGDASVLQRTLNVNGTDLPIIGVAPEGFHGAKASGEMWITFALSDLVFRDGKGQPIHARAAEPFGTVFVGRLKPDATMEQARAQSAALARPLAEARDRGVKELFVVVGPLQDEDPVRAGLQALGLMIVPLIVLAIACVNAANLLLARATRNSGDWLVRLALGATRWRLVRQVLVESVLLAVGGALLGLVVAAWGQRYTQRLVFSDVSIDATVAFFAVASALATALLFGLGPALSVTRAAIARAPEAGRFLRGPFGSRTRSALVVLQAALCLGLLATGAQFARTLRAMSDEGLPQPATFLAVSLDLDQLRYTREQAEAFYRDLLSRVEALPSVDSAALSGKSARSLLAGFVSSWGPKVAVPGVPEAPRGVLTSYVSADFFEVMALPLLRGRTFTAEEQRSGPQVVVVNQKFVERAFGDDGLGRVITLTEGKDGAPVEATVVGVVATPSNRPIFALPTVYFPTPLAHAPALDLIVRVRDGDASRLAPAIRTIVSSMDPRLPIGQMATAEDLRRLRNARDYTLTQVVSILGMLALGLAAAGLYGVVSYAVTLRRKEIGIRMALGAESPTVLRLVLRQSIVPVLLGCALGAVGAMVVGSLLRSRLYGVSAMDPVAFGGAALLLLITMTVASLAPARRAARVNPIDVLRTE